MEHFFVLPEDVQGNEAKLYGDELRHLALVMRLRPGDSLALLDGRGRRYEGVIRRLTKEAADIQLLAVTEQAGESPLYLWLVQGIPKGDKMDGIVQKAVELGAAGVIPAEMNRCVVRLSSQEKKESRRQRWQKIAREAVKQCGRSRLPAVTEFCSLETLAPRLREGFCLIPWEGGGTPLKAVLGEWARTRAADPERPVFIVIGPEGGMEETEVSLLKEAAGGSVITLGPRILRTETAGAAVLAALQFEWGDMGDMGGG
jgi:16S rRNA (uracil1498-N3)-methyltransferase